VTLSGVSGEPIDVLQLLSAMKVEVSHRFDAPIEAVWALLSDVERMAGLGPEHVEAHWLGRERGVGAQFSGKNRRGDEVWEVPCHVTECDRPTRFSWTVLEPENPSSRWCYTLAEEGTGTLVVERFEHGPNYSFTRIWAEEHPAEASSLISERADTLRADMSTTLVNAERVLLSRTT
jgi:uncharacterized protein YndB with AHSA1/START domain